MKKSIILLLALFPAAADAACTGIFQAGSICGSVSGGQPKEVPSSSFTGLIAPNSITNGLLAQATSNSFLCNPTGATANVQYCTGVQVGAAIGAIGGDLLGTLPNPTLNLSLSHIWTTFQTFKVNGVGVVVDNSGASQQSTVIFDSNGVFKWQLGKQSDDSFILFDAAGAAVKFAIASNGNMTLMGNGGSVNIGGAAANTTDALDITENLNAAAHYGLNVTQTVTGFIGAFNYNLFNITSDNASCGASSFCNALGAQISFGGSTTIGGRQGVQASVTLTAPTSGSNTNRNYVGLFGRGEAQTGDGGTNTGAGAQGAVFGMNGVCQLDSSATNILNCTAVEYDTFVAAAATVKYLTGNQIVGGNQAHGATVDAALSIGGQGAHAGWNQGILFSDFNSASPVNANTKLFTNFWTAGGTKAVAIGIDLTGFTFSGNAFQSIGFSVDNSGDITNRAIALAGAAGGLGGGSGSINALFYLINGTSGVSCTAGTLNAATFTAANGIVTHC